MAKPGIIPIGGQAYKARAASPVSADAVSLV
jgi:hypothetical protein